MPIEKPADAEGPVVVQPKREACKERRTGESNQPQVSCGEALSAGAMRDRVGIGDLESAFLKVV